MDANAPNDLLQEARWLERLAVGLVGDAHVAADLAQQAWLAASAAGPVGRRAWLTATLQKLAVRVRRQRVRLAHRERAAAKPEAVASAAELTERAEQHERLLAHVRALAEPYRVAVLLRYYDGLPPRAIAERLGVPVRTVHTRLQRALEQLRARLDAEHPRGRAGWVGALWLGQGPQPVGSASAFAAWVVIGVATFAAGAAWLGHRFAAPAERAPVGVERAAAMQVDDTVSRPTRHSVVDAADAAVWSGQVVDWDGFPLAGARVRVVEHLGLRLAPAMVDEPDQLLAGEVLTLSTPTDALGRFVGPRPAGPVVVYAELPGYTTALAGVWRAEQGVPLRVALAPGIDLERVVLDGEGRPLAGVTARFSLGDAAQWHIDAGSAAHHALNWCAINSDDGWLRLRGIPLVPGATLTLQRPGFRSATFALGSAADGLPAGALTLQPDPDWRSGRVLDARGEPIAGVFVVAGDHTVRTDADGRFTAALPLAAELGLAVPGLAPQRVPVAAGAGEFRLVAPDLQCSGRVRDSAGRPRVGFEVSLVDPTVVGTPLRPQVLESLAAGGDGFVLRAVTDAVGGFALRGLADRPYRLRVVDPRTAAQFETAPLLPSEGVAIAWPDALLHAEVGARVLAADGSPLSGAHVSVQAHAYVVPPLGDAAPATLFAHGASAVADADGRLTLADVPRRGAWLRIYHAATLRAEAALPAVLPAELTLTVPRWAQLSVGYRAANGDEVVELLDVRGAPVAMRQVRALGEQTQLEVRLRQGRSPLLTVPETAVAVRVRHGPLELARAPLALHLGGFVHIDL